MQRRRSPRGTLPPTTEMPSRLFARASRTTDARKANRLRVRFGLVRSRARAAGDRACVGRISAGPAGAGCSTRRPLARRDGAARTGQAPAHAARRVAPQPWRSRSPNPRSLIARSHLGRARRVRVAGRRTPESPGECERAGSAVSGARTSSTPGARGAFWLCFGIARGKRESAHAAGRRCSRFTAETPAQSPARIPLPDTGVLKSALGAPSAARRPRAGGDGCAAARAPCGGSRSSAAGDRTRG